MIKQAHKHEAPILRGTETKLQKICKACVVVNPHFDFLYV